MSTYGFSINVGRTAAGQTFIDKMANWMWLPMLAMGVMVLAGMFAVFGLVHAAAFSLADIDSAHAAWGLLFGVVHWAVVGIALRMLPLMHPRIRYEEPRLVPVAQGSPHYGPAAGRARVLRARLPADDSHGIFDTASSVRRHLRCLEWQLGLIYQTRQRPIIERKTPLIG